MKPFPTRLPVRRMEVPGTGGPIPELQPADLTFLAGLAGVGLVPFAVLGLGGHWSRATLLLGATLVLVCAGQIVAALRHPAAGGRPHGLRVPGPRLVLLRGHLGPRAPVRPRVRGRR